MDNARQKLYDKLRFYEKIFRLDETLLVFYYFMILTSILSIFKIFFNNKKRDGAKSISVQKDLKAEREKELNKVRHEIKYKLSYLSYFD